MDALNITTPTAMNGNIIFEFTSQLASQLKFTFTGQNISVGPGRQPLAGSGGLLSDSIDLKFVGWVTALGYARTPFLADFAASGSCVGTSPNGPCTGESTQSWNVAISSNSSLVIPEPTSLSLFGIGLVGLFASRRRLSAKAVVA